MSIKLPGSISLPQQSPLASLLGGLGTGLAGGTQMALSQLLKSQMQGLTPYQQISTKLREEDIQRKTRDAVRAQLNNLSGITKGVVLPEDVPSLENSIMKSIEEGVNPSVALQEGVLKYGNQKTALTEAQLPKFNSKKSTQLKEEIYSKLQEGKITNQSLINKELTAKKWPTKDRKDILKRLKGKVPMKRKIEERPIEEKRTLSQEEIRRRFEKAPGTTREQKLRNLKKILESEGYSVTGI